MPSNAGDDSMSGHQSASGMNGSLEELLAGFCEDMGDNQGMFAQLNDSQSMMEHSEMKQESIGLVTQPRADGLQDLVMLFVIGGFPGDQRIFPLLEQ